MTAAFGCTIHICIHTHEYTPVWGKIMLTKNQKLPKSVVPARSNFTHPFIILYFSICLVFILFGSFLQQKDIQTTSVIAEKKQLSGVSDPFCFISVQRRFCFSQSQGCCCLLIHNVKFILENQHDEEAQGGDICKGPQTHFAGFGSTLLYQHLQKFYFVHRKL